MVNSFLPADLAQRTAENGVWLNGSWSERFAQYIRSRKKSASPIYPNMLADLSRAKAILILPNDRIGGLFFGLTTYALIRRSYPDAIISLLTTRRLAGVAQQIPAIDKVIVGDWHLPIWKSAFKKLTQQLRQEHFDLAFCLGRDCSFRLARVCRDSGAGLRVGFQRQDGAFNIEMVPQAEVGLEQNAYLKFIEILRLANTAPEDTGARMHFAPTADPSGREQYDIAIDIGEQQKMRLGRKQLISLVDRLLERGTRLAVFYEKTRSRTYARLLKTYGTKIHLCNSRDLAQVVPTLDASRILVSCHTDILQLGIAMGRTCVALGDHGLGRWVDLNSDRINAVTAAKTKAITIGQMLAGIESMREAERPE